jgi:predicted RND superfamily exporter protein
MLRAYARAVTRHAVLVLVLCGAATLLALTQIIDFRTGRLRLEIDPSMEAILPSESPSRTFYDRVRKLFGNDDTLLLVIHRPEGVFTTDVLAGIARLTKRVEDVDGVASVLSLSNAPNVRAVGGDLVIGPLFETPPTDPDELERVEREAFENPLYVGSLIAPGGTTTSLVIQLLDIPEAEFTRRGIDHQIQQAADEELSASGGDVETWLVGTARVKAETVRYLLGDLFKVFPGVFLLITIVAALSFRSVRGVVIPISTIGLSVIWTLGVMAAIDPHLNLVTFSIPALLMVLGFAYGVHVMAAYNDAIEEGRTWDASASARGLATVLLPTALTGGSTVAGFLSLATHSLPAIRQFGLYGGLGVFFGAVAAVTFAPALLHQLRETEPKGRSHEGGHDNAFDRVLAWVGEFDARNATRIFATVIVLCLLSLAGIPRIQVNSTMVSNFPENSAVRLSVEAVNEHLGGAGQINVVFETDYPKGFTEPSILRTLEEFQQWVVQQPTVTGTTSIVDYIKLIHRGFNENDPAQYKIPASKNLVAQLLFFGASEETKRFVDSQYQVANVLVRTTALDSADLGVVVRNVEQRLAKLPEHVKATVTGNLVLIQKTSDEVAYGQAVSVTSAFFSIFAIMAGLFMSIRIGIIAMIPNVFPVLMYFGVLGWTGMTLNVTTGLVASIVLGVAVDDTVHFLTSFNRFSRETGSEQAGVKATLLHVGRPVTYTGIALIAGFLVLSLSSLKMQEEFGYLAAITLAVAWLTDLTFTPAIASRIRVVTLWDVLSLDLGENPHQAIPLFHGFSKWQARIVALLTEIVEVKQGHRLMQTGQKSDGMYLVIEGQLQSHIERDGAQVPLNRHGRGDVLGEVGLFRGERTANVDCVTDCRLLRFDQENLTRLQRRYPRTAAKLMRNLSEVLADRLKAATARLR